MKDGIVAIEVHQVITFYRPRTAAEVETLTDEIVAACCGKGHSTGADPCRTDAVVGGGFTMHFRDDPDHTDWQNEDDYEPEAAALNAAPF